MVDQKLKINVYSKLHGHGVIISPSGNTLPNETILLKGKEKFRCNKEDLKTTIPLKIQTFFKKGEDFEVNDKSNFNPFKPFSLKIKCLNEHPLSFMNNQFYQGNYECEKCKNPFPPTSGAWRCDKCKYDLCPNCYGHHFKNTHKDKYKDFNFKNSPVNSYDMKMVSHKNIKRPILSFPKGENPQEMIEMVKYALRDKIQLKNEKEYNIFVMKNVTDKKVLDNLKLEKTFGIKMENTLNTLEHFLNDKDILVGKAENKTILMGYEGDDEKSEKQIESVRKKGDATIILYAPFGDKRGREWREEFEKKHEDVFICFNAEFIAKFIKTVPKRKTSIIKNGGKKQKVSKTLSELKVIKKELEDRFMSEGIKEVMIDINITDKISDLKTKVAEKFNIRQENVLLTFCGRVLEDDNNTIYGENITPDYPLLFSYENKPVLLKFEENNNYSVQAYSDEIILTRKKSPKQNKETIYSKNSLSSGVYYFEVEIGKQKNEDVKIGISQFPFGKGKVFGGNKGEYALLPYEYEYLLNGDRMEIYRKGIRGSEGGIIGFLLDMDNKVLSFVKDGMNGSHLGTAFSNLPEKVYVAFSLMNAGSQITLSSFAKEKIPCLFNTCSSSLLILPRRSEGFFVVATANHIMEEVGFFAGDTCYCTKRHCLMVIAGIVVHPKEDKGRLLSYEIPFDPALYSTYALKGIEKELELENKAINSLSAPERLQNYILGHLKM